MINAQSKAEKRIEAAALVSEYLAQGGRIHTAAPRKPWRR
jgi:hypothetical protein